MEEEMAIYISRFDPIELFFTLQRKFGFNFRICQYYFFISSLGTSEMLSKPDKEDFTCAMYKNLKAEI